MHSALGSTPRLASAHVHAPHTLCRATWPPPQCTRAQQGLGTTTRAGREYRVAPSVAAQFKFAPLPGINDVLSTGTRLSFSPFPVVAESIVSITATLQNIGTAPGKVGLVALWLVPYDGSDPNAPALGSITGAAATLDLSKRVLRPGASLKVG